MKILILGGDERYYTLINGLSLKHDVDTVGFDNSIELNKIDISKYNLVILPISGINDNYEVKTINGILKVDGSFFKGASSNLVVYTGIINKTLKDMIGELKLISFLSDQKVNKENNDITVDGIINELSKNNYKKICILGYGNIGRGLDEKLCGYDLIFGVKEYKDFCILKDRCFYTCNPNIMKEVFSRCDCIINTVPENIITIDCLENCTAKIIDVASHPYGACQSVREMYGNYKIYSGIPAKYSPSRSGKILLNKMQKEIGG